VAIPAHTGQLQSSWLRLLHQWHPPPVTTMTVTGTPMTPSALMVVADHRRHACLHGRPHPSSTPGSALTATPSPAPATTPSQDAPSAR